MNNKDSLKSDVKKIMSKICNKIAKIIEDGKSQGVLKPTKEKYTKLENSFKEENNLIKRTGFSSDETLRESWWEAIRIIEWKIKESREYKTTLQKIKEIVTHNEESSILENFVRKISRKFLETEDKAEREKAMTELISIIEKYSNEERLKQVTIEIKLDGIVPTVKPLEFKVNDTNYLLRRIQKEDFPNELPMNKSSLELMRENPTAVLEIKTFPKFDRELQEIENQAITILRLFKSASITRLSATYRSDCFWYWLNGSSSFNHRNHSVVLTETIEENEKELFESFFKKMVQEIPKDAYLNNSTSFGNIEIALQRYTDSLFIWQVPIERRIADAVMGLESLFLTSNENMELSYRLRIRVAKVLGLFDFDPYQSKDIANDAYSIRSAFVHGDKVKRETQKNINKKYGELKNLHKLVLEQLRIAIIIQVILKIGKDNFIKLIDNSFIDSSQLQILETHLQTVFPFITSTFRTQVKHDFETSF